MILYSDGYMSYAANSFLAIEATNIIRCKHDECTCHHLSSQTIYYDMYVPKQLDIQDGMSISGLWKSENEFIDAPDGYMCAKCNRINVCQKKSILTPLRNDIFVVLPRFKELENGSKVKNRALIHLDDLQIPKKGSANNNENERWCLYGYTKHSSRILSTGHYYGYVTKFGKQWYLNDYVVRLQKFEKQSRDAYLLHYHKMSD